MKRKHKRRVKRRYDGIHLGVEFGSEVTHVNTKRKSRAYLLHVNVFVFIVIAAKIKIITTTSCMCKNKRFSGIYLSYYLSSDNIDHLLFCLVPKCFGATVSHLKLIASQHLLFILISYFSFINSPSYCSGVSFYISPHAYLSFLSCSHLMLPCHFHLVVILSESRAKKCCAENESLRLVCGPQKSSPSYCRKSSPLQSLLSNNTLLSLNLNAIPVKYLRGGAHLGEYQWIYIA